MFGRMFNKPEWLKTRTEEEKDKQHEALEQKLKEIETNKREQENNRSK